LAEPAAGPDRGAGGRHVWSLFKNRNAEGAPAPIHDAAWSVRIGYGAAYLALASFLH
jgi:hypothetical protein